MKKRGKKKQKLKRRAASFIKEEEEEEGFVRRGTLRSARETSSRGLYSFIANARRSSSSTTVSSTFM